jgi:hypothetical protein
MGIDFEALRVRPVSQDEEGHYRELMQAHHYLGDLAKIGRTIWYVATLGEAWVALLSISAAAWKCGVRDRWIGWDYRHQYDRLGLVANNSRFLILPEWHLPNLGSKVLSLCEKRLAADWQTRFGQPLLLLETFVDPTRFQGTVYRAANWTCLGLTQGLPPCLVQRASPARTGTRLGTGWTALGQGHADPAAGTQRRRGPGRRTAASGRRCALAATFRALLEEAKEECPAPDKPHSGTRGRPKRSKARNLLERLEKFEHDTLRFMTDPIVPFTNNQGENDLRMTKVQQKISGCFRSMAGAKAFCRIRSYLSTCRKNAVSATDALTLLFQGKLPDFVTASGGR